jgi:hypothetical protein
MSETVVGSLSRSSTGTFSKNGKMRGKEGKRGKAIPQTYN